MDINIIFVLIFDVCYNFMNIGCKQTSPPCQHGQRPTLSYIHYRGKSNPSVVFREGGNEIEWSWLMQQEELLRILQNKKRANAMNLMALAELNNLP